MNRTLEIRLSTSHNVYKYYQVLIFLEFASSFFKIHDYFLKNHNINIDKNINLKIIHEIHLYNKRSYSYYLENNIYNVDYYYNILIRLNDLIAYFSYRNKKRYLLNFQSRHLLLKIRIIFQRHFVF